MCRGKSVIITFNIVSICNRNVSIFKILSTFKYSAESFNQYAWFPRNEPETRKVNKNDDNNNDKMDDVNKIKIPSNNTMHFLFTTVAISFGLIWFAIDTFRSICNYCFLLIQFRFYFRFRCGKINELRIWNMARCDQEIESGRERDRKPANKVGRGEMHQRREQRRRGNIFWFVW